MMWRFSRSNPRFIGFKLPIWALCFLVVLMGALASCGMENEMKTTNDRTAADLLGNPSFPAISYGGYRGLSRSEQPTLNQLKEDMKILHAMGIRFLRTYNVQLPHAGNVV